jgi:Domain of unknown function (DUF5615)
LNMASIYSNENIRIEVVKILRALGHDVLTSEEAGNANKRIPDDLVLAYSIKNQRTVLTYNRKDYIRLNRLVSEHFGIITCTEDHDDFALAHRIHAALEAAGGNLENQLIRINRPNPSQKSA